jgi:hypothetical protein
MTSGHDAPAIVLLDYNQAFATINCIYERPPVHGGLS